MTRSEIFLNDIPEKFLQAVLETIFDAYRDAAVSCFNRFDPPWAITALPGERRSLIEQGFYDSADEIGLDVTVKVDDSNFWRHTVVHSDRVILTVNKVAREGSCVPNSNLRRAYSSKDNQTLFPWFSEDVAPKTLVYASLLHGQKDSKEKMFPGFAKIVFPRKDLQGQYLGEICLFDLFPEVVSQKQSGSFEEFVSRLDVRDQFKDFSADTTEPEIEFRDDIGGMGVG